MNVLYEEYPYCLHILLSIITTVILISIEFVSAWFTIRQDFNNIIEFIIFNGKIWIIIIIIIGLLYVFVCNRIRKTYYYDNNKIIIKHHITPLYSTYINIDKSSIHIEYDITNIQYRIKKGIYSKYYKNKFSTINRSDILLISIRNNRKGVVNRSVFLEFKAEPLPEYLAIPKEVI